jgi:hypothetical protein
MAIVTLLDQIINAIDNNNFAIGIFIDFAKAFDTVNHQIFLSKLYHYGVRGIAHDWLKSYLTNRKQYCTFQSAKSDFSTITCWVPQGSILGPLLFLLYVNDMGSIFNNINAVLFADDTNLIVTSNTLKQAENTANNELPLLINWLNTNRLSLNIKKTHMMIFGKTLQGRNQHFNK